MTQASFSLYGAGDGLTGIGGLTSATLNVVAGSTLTVGVGGQGTTDAGGFGGGGAPGVLAEGGGGASWVTDSDGTALLVAGGAGGTAFGDAAQNGPESGGAGGGQAGDAGSNDLSCDDQGCDLDFGGGSGTQSFVFNAGFGEHEGGSTGYGPLMFDGTDVTDAAAGGAGSATAQCNVPSAFFDPIFGGGGGGGGGYFGGGGGAPCAGGGGGSGYVTPSVLSGSTVLGGGSVGPGEVDITYTVQPPTITSSDEAFFELGHAGSFTVNATGNPAPTFSETGTLPAGMTFSGAGVFSGTPTQSGLFYVTITATNGYSPDAVQSFVLVVNAPPTITSANSATFAEGVADAFTVTGTGFPAPTFTETGSLPTGLALSSAGVLSGTPTQLGTFPITLTASNGISPNATQSFTLTVATSTNPVPSDELAWGYGTNGELGNGTTTSTQMTPVPVSLPPGVTATATAAGSETGYAIGSNNVLYAWGSGTDGQLGNGTTTATQTSAVAVSLPAGSTAVASGALTSYALGSNGTVYAWGYGPDGELGNGTTTYAQTTPVAVSLPTGVTATAIGAAGYTGYAMGSNGTLYAWGNGADGELGNGTTTAAQATPVAVSLPAGVTATAIAGGEYTAYALGSNGTVYAWGFGTNGELGNGTTTSTQTTPVAVSLPTGVTATAIAAGALNGYALGSNGTLYAWGNGTGGQLGNGTTTDPQTKPIAVSLPSGVTATAIGASEFTGFAIGTNGTLYAWGTGADGNLGNGTTTFSQTTPVAASLPAGVVPTALGSGPLSETDYAVVRPAVTLSQGSLTATTIAPGAGYAGQLTLTNLPTGGGSLTWTTTISSSEVTVSSSGAVTVPTSVTTPGTVAVSGTVRDAVGDTGNWSFTLTVNGTPPTITSANSATFTQGQAGTFTLTATGDPAPTFSGTGSLPIGVTLTSAGVLSGTPTQSGTFPITITATNGESPDATQSFTLTVDGPPTITSGSSATFTQSQAGSFTVTATGTPSSAFTETGALPTGVTLSSAGVLSGTPTQAGFFPITITATNGVPPNATQTFTLTVDGPPTITSANSATFTQGQAGGFTVTATGTPSSTFNETGSLPNGVTLSSAGVLVGTATQSGSFPITITATNGVSPDATQSFTLTVDEAPSITSANSTTFAEGMTGSFTVTATGYPAPTFSETGTLPSGITLSSAGVLSGTTTQSGTFHFTIDAGNGVAPDATQSFTLTVTQLFQIWTSTLPNATPGQSYGPVPLQAIGQASGATLKWKKAGTLPKGLKVKGGFLEGTSSLKLVHGANLSVPIQVTEKWVAVSGRIKTKHSVTVTKTLMIHIN